MFYYNLLYEHTGLFAREYDSGTFTFDIENTRSYYRKIKFPWIDYGCTMFINQESSKKMISKSLSKIGKSKETLQKEKEQGLKAMYKLSLLINKKLRAIRFNFFVKLEEHCKQITN